MIELLGSIWDLIVKILATSPAPLRTMTLALIGSALLTQWVKFYFPVEWSAKLRAFLAQNIAFWTSRAIVYLLWPIPEGFVAGACVGIASPTIYAITVRVVGLKWPAIRDLLSGDVRSQ